MALNLEMRPKLQGVCEVTELFIHQRKSVCGGPGALHAIYEKEEPNLACPASSIES